MKETLIQGVCCAYCSHFEHPRCPVESASPWSRFKNFCSEYVPNPNITAACSLEEGMRLSNTQTVEKKKETAENE